MMLCDFFFQEKQLCNTRTAPKLKCVVAFLFFFCCKSSPHCIKLRIFSLMLCHIFFSRTEWKFHRFNHTWESWDWVKGKKCRDKNISTKRWQRCCRKKINSSELRFELCNDFVLGGIVLTLRYDSNASSSSKTSWWSICEK